MLGNIRKILKNSDAMACYDELIHIFISVTYKSSAAYASAAIIYVWFLYPFIPLYILTPWAIAQLLYPLVRLYLSGKYRDVHLTDEVKVRFQYIHIALAFVGGVMWGMGSVLCAIYAPSPYEYMVLVLIVGLSAGSLSTLSPLYRVYLAYNLPSLLLLLISFLMYTDNLHYALAFMIGIFMLIVPSASGDVHETLKHSIELKGLYLNAQKTLEETNQSLEDKVKVEVEYNRQKDKHMLEQSRLAQMGEMISMIAHQWRQPLASITATTGSMVLHMQLEEYNEKLMEEKIEKINNYAQYLSATITDFRNFFKPDKEKSLTSLNDIVKGSLGIIGTSLEAQGVRIEIFLESKEEIYSYPNELKQVVLNIIKNAQDAYLEKSEEDAGHSPESHPRILIKTYTDDDNIQLIIQDNAGGIPEDKIANIFDPYFTTKEKKDGTGIGLYMSKLIVEDHCSGKLSVENKDNGACFTLTLPRE